MNKKLIAAAMLSSLLAGIPLYADDAPATTQPTDAKRVFVLVRTDGTVPPGAPAPVAIGGAPIPPGQAPQGGIIRAINTNGDVIYQAAGPAKTEKTAWLGVAASPPPLALLKQLKIKNGLVVDDVKTGSPAEAAGLKPQDIIEKLDDQLLINPAQLEALVRMHNPGDSVSLTILHEGARSTIAAKLVEHDVLVMPDGIPQMIQVAPAFAQPGTVQGGNAAGTRMQMAPGAQAHVEVMTRGNGTGSMSQYSNGNHELTITQHDNQRILTIKDSNGKQLFEGPIDTPEQQTAIPKDLMQEFDAMQKMSNMTDGVPKPE